jgi:hypothetical protein
MVGWLGRVLGAEVLGTELGTQRTYQRVMRGRSVGDL